MTNATAPRKSTDQKLLVIDTDGHAVSADFRDLSAWLRPGDVVIVNDAAVFPASLQGQLLAGSPGSRDEESALLEIRLLPKVPSTSLWSAVAFGPGNWKMTTESRPPPPALSAGSKIRFAGNLHATVASVSSRSRRLIELRFSETDPEVWAGIYSFGTPVQYSYLQNDLALWSVQTAYSSRPWASEMPSAGKPLNWELLLRLIDHGVHIHALTHSTGLSSTGDPTTDALLPLPEFYEIPVDTALAIRNARKNGHRIIAVGTSVVRALETQFRTQSPKDGEIRAGMGQTDLILNAEFRLQVVDAILTGMHEMEESHYRLLSAFANQETLANALRLADNLGYLKHEFGDSSLIFRSSA